MYGQCNTMLVNTVERINNCTCTRNSYVRVQEFMKLIKSCGHFQENIAVTEAHCKRLYTEQLT